MYFKLKIRDYDWKKIIVVFGATGAQGGGVARAILNDPKSEFAVRAVTRDPNSDKAKELAKMGADVVVGEIDDNRMPTLQGKYKVPHFDGKGESDHYFIDAGVPVAFLLTTFYWENMLYFGMGPKKGQDGKLTITFPMGNKKLSGIAAEDIGKCAYGIFKRGKELIGKTVGIAGDQLACNDMAQVLTKTLGKEVTYHEITPEQYRSLGFPGADDLGKMFQFYRDFEEVFDRTRDVWFSKELDPELKSFEKWAKENAVLLLAE